MKYAIQISDRENTRHITLERGEDMEMKLAEIIGARCLGHPRLESWSADGTAGTYQAMIQIGRSTPGGGTPFTNIYVYVHAE